jgi:hypothetical protein
MILDDIHNVPLLTAEKIGYQPPVSMIHAREAAITSPPITPKNPWKPYILNLTMFQRQSTLP